MASGRGGGNVVWVICGVALLICCGVPVYSWRIISQDNDAREEMKPAAVSFLDAWRDGDRARAEPLTCGYLRDDLARRIREDDLTSYRKLEVHVLRKDSGMSYHAEADLTFADGRRHRYRMAMADAGGWRVCSVSETSDW